MSILRLERKQAVGILEHSGNQAISWWTQPWRCVDCRLLSHAMISTIPWQWPFNEKGVMRLGSLTCGPHLMCCPSDCRRVPRPSSNWTCTGDRTVEGAASKHETGLGLWVWAWSFVSKTLKAAWSPCNCQVDHSGQQFVWISVSLSQGVQRGSKGQDQSTGLGGDRCQQDATTCFMVKLSA